MIKLASDSIDVGLVVSDAAASLEFYCDVLGFARGAALPLPGNRTMHDVHVGSSVLKLQELHDGAPPPGPRGHTSQVGIRYITISVEDLDGVVHRLEDRGCVFTHRLEMTPRGVRMAMLEDPDGNTIELMEASIE